MMAIRIVVLLIVVSASVSPMGRASAADSTLSNLACVRLNAVRAKESLDIGPSSDELAARLFVAAKAQLPRLRVDPSCENELVAWLYVKNLSKGSVDAYYSHFELRLVRPAILKATQRSFESEVWNSGLHYGHGPVAKVKERAMENLDTAITRFAAAYYQAGNP